MVWQLQMSACQIRARPRATDWHRYHDDVIKWKHFPRYCPFVRGIHRSQVNSPHKGQWCGALMFSLICAWINGWVNNREAGDWRCYCAHYDVTVMIVLIPIRWRSIVACLQGCAVWCPRVCNQLCLFHVRVGVLRSIVAVLSTKSCSMLGIWAIDCLCISSRYEINRYTKQYRAGMAPNS